MKNIIALILLATILNAESAESEKCGGDAFVGVELIKMGQKEKGELWLKTSCDEGCGIACIQLDRNDLKRGCEAKVPHGWACYQMSYDLKDEKKKLELKRKGCESGYAMGCDFLAGGFAREENYGLALKYYNIGCDFGDDQSCGQLGMIYARGDYGETSPQKAYKYWSKSVKLNPNNDASKDNLKILCKNNPSICK